MIKGRCTTSIFAIENVFRGFAGENGEGSISLPVAFTISQAVLSIAFMFIGAIIHVIVFNVLQVNAFVSMMIFLFVLPLVAGYLLGQAKKDRMNIVQNIILRIKTKYEPNELIGFQEVEKADTYSINERIRWKRHVN